MSRASCYAPTAMSPGSATISRTWTSTSPAGSAGPPARPGLRNIGTEIGVSDDLPSEAAGRTSPTCLASGGRPSYSVAMADSIRVMLEQGKKKRIVACAFDWPGWDRSARIGHDVLAVLAAYRP